MKPLGLLRPLFVAAILTSCNGSPTPPSEADARAALERNIGEFSQGCIKLVDFRKTGKKELGDVTLVTASADIEFLEDCHWPFKTAMIVLKITEGETPGVKKGERRTVTVTLQFHRTGKGWEPTGEKTTATETTL